MFNSCPSSWFQHVNDMWKWKFPRDCISHDSNRNFLDSQRIFHRQLLDYHGFFPITKSGTRLFLPLLTIIFLAFFDEAILLGLTNGWWPHVISCFATFCFKHQDTCVCLFPISNIHDVRHLPTGVFHRIWRLPKTMGFRQKEFNTAENSRKQQRGFAKKGYPKICRFILCPMKIDLWRLIPQCSNTFKYQMVGQNNPMRSPTGIPSCPWKLPLKIPSASTTMCHGEILLRYMWYMWYGNSILT